MPFGGTANPINTWMTTLATLNLAHQIADNTDFVAMPMGARGNATETARIAMSGVNGTLRQWTIRNNGNSLGMDLVFTLRVRQADVVPASTITFTAGLSGVTYVVTGLDVPISIGDFISARVDFDDPVEAGNAVTNSSAIGGN